MTFPFAQLRKEVRPLLLPWIAIMLVGTLSLFHTPGTDFQWRYVDMLSWILPLGSFFAIPLLAALPLGSEFQNSTLVLLLAQPAHRQALWLQKIAITLLAVVPATVLYLFSARINPEFEGGFWPAAVWILMSTSGSVAGTLIARSTVGGLALSSAFQGLLFLIWNRFAEPQFLHKSFSPGFLVSTALILICYAVGMVLLGRSMFLRFQTVEGGHAGLDRIPGAAVLARIGADWLRCRPRGVVLNLIKREFYLLRIVWLLGVFAAFTWICLVFSGILLSSNNDFRAPVAAAIAATLSFTIAILAGTLSLGEEKNWGTHSWQLTMPLSLSAQWFVKLSVALFTSVICSVAIPLSVLFVGGWFSGSPFVYLEHTRLWPYVLTSVLFTLVAFWSGCAVKGTVPAVVTFFSFLFGFGYVMSLSPWLVEEARNSLQALFPAVVARLDPIHVYHVVALILGAEIQGNPGNYLASDMGGATFSVTVLLLVAVGLMQSRRLFRMAHQPSASQTVLRVLPLLAICFLPNLVAAGFLEFCQVSWQQRSTMWTEAHNAIEAIQLSRTGPEAAKPLRLTLQDLANTSTLSDSTRKWLGNSRIVVVPGATTPISRWPHLEWPYENASIIPHQPDAKVAPYAAQVQTATGHQCNLWYWAESSKSHGILLESCQ
jgi:hypothetical protein